MNTSIFTKLILAIVLPSLRISPLLRIAAIVLFYTVVISRASPGNRMVPIYRDHTVPRTPGYPPVLACHIIY